MGSRIGGPPRRCQFDLPQGVAPDHYRRGLRGPLCLGLSLGVQLMLTGLLLTVRHEKPPPPEHLTDLGAALYWPEHDIALYVLGCGLTLLLMFMAVAIWNRHLHAAPATSRPALIRRCAAVMTLAGGCGMASYILLFLWLRHDSFASLEKVAAAALLSTPALFSIGLVHRAFRSGLTPRARPLAQGPVPQGPVPPSRPHEQRAPARAARGLTTDCLMADCWQARPGYLTRALDIGMAVLICAVVYVPNWRLLSGYAFSGEAVEFHHWDFFAMGPALGYSHGAALGTDVFAQYGVGWPVLFTALSPRLPLGYGHMLHISVIYGCLYFMGVYVLLRLLLKHPVIAAAGVVLAMHFHLFEGQFVGLVAWILPSTTLLRAPLDVWFFIALLMHLRSRRAAWALVAAAAVGLALFFITDSGVFLGITFAFYWVVVSLAARLAPSPEPVSGLIGFGRSYLKLVLGSFAVTLLVLMPGLALASRWTLGRKEFWTGWLETFLQLDSHVGLLPAATFPDGLSILFFIVILGVYLWTVGALFIRLLHREAPTGDIVPACVSFYGLMTLLQFVGRSHPFQLFHVAVPFTIMVALLSDRDYQSRSRDNAVYRFMPYGNLAALLIIMSANPNFRFYPNLFQTVAKFQSVTKASSTQGLCLFGAPPDACGPGGFRAPLSGPGRQDESFARGGQDNRRARRHGHDVLSGIRDATVGALFAPLTEPRHQDTSRQSSKPVGDTRPRLRFSLWHRPAREGIHGSPDLERVTHNDPPTLCLGQPGWPLRDLAADLRASK